MAVLAEATSSAVSIKIPHGFYPADDKGAGLADKRRVPFSAYDPVTERRRLWAAERAEAMVAERFAVGDATANADAFSLSSRPSSSSSSASDASQSSSSSSSASDASQSSSSLSTTRFAEQQHDPLCCQAIRQRRIVHVEVTRSHTFTHSDVPSLLRDDASDDDDDDDAKVFHTVGKHGSHVVAKDRARAARKAAIAAHAARAPVDYVFNAEVDEYVVAAQSRDSRRDCNVFGRDFKADGSTFDSRISRNATGGVRHAKPAGGGTVRDTYTRVLAGFPIVDFSYAHDSDTQLHNGYINDTSIGGNVSSTRELSSSSSINNEVSGDDSSDGDGGDVVTDDTDDDDDNDGVDFDDWKENWPTHVHSNDDNKKADPRPEWIATIDAADTDTDADVAGASGSSADSCDSGTDTAENSEISAESLAMAMSVTPLKTVALDERRARELAERKVAFAMKMRHWEDRREQRRAVIRAMNKRARSERMQQVEECAARREERAMRRAARVARRRARRDVKQRNKQREMNNDGNGNGGDAGNGEFSKTIDKESAAAASAALQPVVVGVLVAGRVVKEPYTVYELQQIREWSHLLAVAIQRYQISAFKSGAMQRNLRKATSLMQSLEGSTFVSVARREAMQRESMRASGHDLIQPSGAAEVLLSTGLATDLSEAEGAAAVAGRVAADVAVILTPHTPASNSALPPGTGGLTTGVAAAADEGSTSKPLLGLFPSRLRIGDGLAPLGFVAHTPKNGVGSGSGGGAAAAVAQADGSTSTRDDADAMIGAATAGGANDTVGVVVWTSTRTRDTSDAAVAAVVAEEISPVPTLNTDAVDTAYVSSLKNESVKGARDAKSEVDAAAAGAAVDSVAPAPSDKAAPASVATTPGGPSRETSRPPSPGASYRRLAAQAGLTSSHSSISAPASSASSVLPSFPKSTSSSSSTAAEVTAPAAARQVSTITPEHVDEITRWQSVHDDFDLDEIVE
jgi:hypothetical protein